MSSESKQFENLVEIAQNAANGIFNDEQIGSILRSIIDENFEETQEVLDDLHEFDQCCIVSYTSQQICQNKENNIKYKWDESSDKSILYQLLRKLFKDNITDLATLIRTFSNMTNQSKSQSIPSTLTECTTNDIITVSDVVISKMNKNTKKPTNIDIVQCFLIEHKLNGQMLSNMKEKEFMDKARAYSIPVAKGRKLFNGIIGYFGYDHKINKVMFYDTVHHVYKNIKFF